MLHAGNLGPICAAQQGLWHPPLAALSLERTRVLPGGRAQKGTRARARVRRRGARTVRERVRARAAPRRARPPPAPAPGAPSRSAVERDRREEEGTEGGGGDWRARSPAVGLPVRHRAEATAGKKAERPPAARRSPPPRSHLQRVTQTRTRTRARERDRQEPHPPPHPSPSCLAAATELGRAPPCPIRRAGRRARALVRAPFPRPSVGASKNYRAARAGSKPLPAGARARGARRAKTPSFAGYTFSFSFSFSFFFFSLTSRCARGVWHATHARHPARPTRRPRRRALKEGGGGEGVGGRRTARLWATAASSRGHARASDDNISTTAAGRAPACARAGARHAGGPRDAFSRPPRARPPRLGAGRRRRTGCAGGRAARARAPKRRPRKGRRPPTRARSPAFSRAFFFFFSFSFSFSFVCVCPTRFPPKKAASPKLQCTEGFMQCGITCGLRGGVD